MFVCRKYASVRPFAVKIFFSQKSVLLNSSYSGVAVSRGVAVSVFFFFCQKKKHDTNIQYITKLNRNVI